MEIGSFLELDLRNSGEHYEYGDGMAKLNSARSAIYHAVRMQGASSIYLPYYLCYTVKDFLVRKGISVYFYHINNQLAPEFIQSIENSSVLIVNYFGIFSPREIQKRIHKYTNVIIDNCPSFYSKPIDGVYNVYSLRKFFGVPDGAYLIGEKANQLVNEYDRDVSSHTAAYLLKRIELGSSAIYEERMLNERRIDESDIMRMSILTQKLLEGIDYELIRKKRNENFLMAHDFFKDINLLNLNELMDPLSSPMVYPLVIEKSDLVKLLAEKGIYTGRWWKHVLNHVGDRKAEAWLSKYMLPIPIDQRYGYEELNKINLTIRSLL